MAVTVTNSIGLAEAALWTPAGTTLLGGIGGQSYANISSAWGCNDDGSVVVGFAWLDVDTHHAFRWDAASSNAALVGGANVWAQFWSRDPASPSTTNLTDAVTFTLWP